MNSNYLIFIIFHIFNKTNLYSSQNERDYQAENIAQYYSNYVNKTYPFDKLIWKFSQRDESHSCSEMFCHRNRLMEDNFELLFQYSVYYVSIACLLIVVILDFYITTVKLRVNDKKALGGWFCGFNSYQSRLSKPVKQKVMKDENVEKLGLKMSNQASKHEKDK